MLEIRHYFSKYHTYLDNVMLLHVQYQLELPASIDAEVSKQQWPFQSSSGQLVHGPQPRQRNV